MKNGEVFEKPIYWVMNKEGYHYVQGGKIRYGVKGTLGVVFHVRDSDGYDFVINTAWDRNYYASNRKDAEEFAKKCNEGFYKKHNIKNIVIGWIKNTLNLKDK